jgi:hypothetical protein
VAAKTEASLTAALRRLAADLRELKQRWALVGGLAVGVRAEPRFTRDVDVVIAVDADSEAERLVLQLRMRGYVLRTMLEHVPTGRIGTVRLTTPSAPGILVDLLFAASGIEPEVVAAARPATVMRHLRLPVARRSHLLAMKVLAAHPDRRPQDFLDIRALLQEAAPSERALTTALLKVMTRRGFSGRKDLLVEWRAALRRFGVRPTR